MFKGVIYLRFPNFDIKTNAIITSGISAELACEEIAL